jgi:hypothetical protein
MDAPNNPWRGVPLEARNGSDISHCPLNPFSAPNKPRRKYARKQDGCEPWDRVEGAPRAPTVSPKAVNASEEFLGQGCSSKATETDANRPQRRESATSDPAAVIGPVQHCLPLPSPAVAVASFAMLPDRRDVPLDRSPSSNLPRVVACPPAQVIPAVPLKPSARILWMNPAVPTPFGERLRCVDAKEVQARLMTIRAQLCAREPARRKFVATVSHVLAAEDAEREHLLRRELRLEAGREVTSDGLSPVVDVTFLHHVVDDDLPSHGQRVTACSVGTRRSTSRLFTGR